MPILKDEIDQRLSYAVFFEGIDSDKRVSGSDPNIELMQELPDAVGTGFYFGHYLFTLKRLRNGLGDKTAVVVAAATIISRVAVMARVAVRLFGIRHSLYLLHLFS